MLLWLLAESSAFPRALPSQAGSRRPLPLGFRSPSAGKSSVLLRASVVALGLPVSPG